MASISLGSRAASASRAAMRESIACRLISVWSFWSNDPPQAFLVLRFPQAFPVFRLPQAFLVFARLAFGFTSPCLPCYCPCLTVDGGPTWTRTKTGPVMSRGLCQLSYGPGGHHTISPLTPALSPRERGLLLTTRGSSAASWSARDGAACAGPWPRSGGCARGRPRSPGRLLPACARSRLIVRRAAAAPFLLAASAS